MISINIFGGLAPLVQFVLIVALFAIVLVIAFSRTAATNLAAFLRELHTAYLQHHQHGHHSLSEQEIARDPEKSGLNTNKEQVQSIVLSRAKTNEQTEQGYVEQSSEYKGL